MRAAEIHADFQGFFCSALGKPSCFLLAPCSTGAGLAPDSSPGSCPPPEEPGITVAPSTWSHGGILGTTGCPGGAWGLWEGRGDVAQRWLPPWRDTEGSGSPQPSTHLRTGRGSTALRRSGSGKQSRQINPREGSGLAPLCCCCCCCCRFRFPAGMVRSLLSRGRAAASPKARQAASL